MEPTQAAAAGPAVQCPALAAGMAAAAVWTVALLVWWRPAPYGRYSEAKGWGLLVPARAAWMVRPRALVAQARAARQQTVTPGRAGTQAQAAGAHLPSRAARLPSPAVPPLRLRSAAPRPRPAWCGTLAQRWNGDRNGSNPRASPPPDPRAPRLRRARPLARRRAGRARPARARRRAGQRAAPGAVPRALRAPRVRLPA